MTNAGSDREICPECHFEWAIVRPEEVSARILSAVGQFATILTAGADQAMLRPAPTRWSSLEYGAHLRDVLLLVRDRIILTSIEDNPTPFPLYREERVGLNLYAGETPRSVADDLEMAARLFGKTFDVLREQYAERTLVYGYPTAAVRTVAWTGAQVVHECEHHLDDVRHNAVVLRAN